MDCPLCERTLSKFSTLSRHFSKLHKRFIDYAASFIGKTEEEAMAYIVKLVKERNTDSLLFLCAPDEVTISTRFLKMAAKTVSINDPNPDSK